MLSSDRIDALFIEKIRNYIDLYDDFILFKDPGNNDDTTEFFEKYKSEILPILLDNLSSPSAIERNAAVGFLRKITGQNFGFNPRIQYSQEEIIQQWKDYIEREY